MTVAEINRLEAMLRVDSRPLLDRRKRYVCPECGVKFLAGHDWGYRIGGVLYHTWSCLRKAERRMQETGEIPVENKSGYIRPSAFEGHLEEIKARLEAGETLGEIAISFDRTQSPLKLWLKNQIGEEEFNALKKRNRTARASAKPGREEKEDGGMLEIQVPEISEEVDEIREEKAEPIRGETVFRMMKAETIEQAWMALGTIRGICRTQLLEDYLAPINEAIGQIAEALR